MKIAFILLAHEPADQLKDLMISLLASGSDVYVHHDLKCSDNLVEIASSWDLTRYIGRLYHARRLNVAWGEWSIVEATLNCMRLAKDHGYNTDYMMLLSGSCMPIKPIAALEAFLFDHPDTDFIETVNAVENKWVKGGIQQERWETFFLFNFRTQRKRFEWSHHIQRKLKIKRTLPLNHIPYMGSQWWCLRTSTLNQVLELLDQYPEIESFYRYTWIPDELFFQTLVANLIPQHEIHHEILTRYRFNRYGIPRVYYDDDLAELMSETTFFARKISYRALRLRQHLSQVAIQDAESIQSTPFRDQLLEGLGLMLHYEQNLWHHHILKQSNKYDYVKSIPNTIIAVAYTSPRLGHQAMIELSQAIPDALLVNHLNARALWYAFLGDIAFQHPNKKLLIDLKETPKSYIEILRWKLNAHIIYINESVDCYFEHTRDDQSMLELKEQINQELEMQKYISYLLHSGEHKCKIHALSIHQLPLLFDLFNTISDRKIEQMGAIE